MKKDNSLEDLLILYLVSVIGIFTSLSVLAYCGRSAHSEAGWMKGAGKKVIVYQIWEEEPELMYKLFDGVCSMGVGLQMFLAEFDKEKNNV